MIDPDISERIVARNLGDAICDALYFSVGRKLCRRFKDHNRENRAKEETFKRNKKIRIASWPTALHSSKSRWNGTILS